MTTEDYALAHLDRLDDQLTHEYGDNAPLIKAAIHWCITGDTVGTIGGARILPDDLEWSDLEDVCNYLRDVGGLDDLCDKIEDHLRTGNKHLQWYLTRPWGKLKIWRRLGVIDILLANHGTETVFTDDSDPSAPALTYSNTGESSATTIGYDTDGDWHVCSYADWVEEMETQEDY